MSEEKGEIDYVFTLSVKPFEHTVSWWRECVSVYPKNMEDYAYRTACIMGSKNVSRTMLYELKDSEEHGTLKQLYEKETREYIVTKVPYKLYMEYTNEEIE